MNKKIIFITACGHKKESSKAPAWKLYKSSRIRHLKKKTDSLKVPFFILSAKHGLIPAEEVIEPYNAIMNEERKTFLLPQVKSILKDFDTVVFYKGGARKDYHNCLEEACKALSKGFISFGFANMGDVGLTAEILQSCSKNK